MRFFLHFSKNYCIFAPVISPRLGIMSFGWGGCRHNKALKSALCLASLNLENSIAPTHCSILMSSGYVSLIITRASGACVYVYISAWASVLLVQS